jgi:hypothetical protein
MYANSKILYTGDFAMKNILLTVFVLLVSCSNTSGQIFLENAFPNLSFSRPVDLQNAGDGSNRIFVVEQPGIIKVFKNASDVPAANVFLDIRDKVDDSSNEEGLLGLAFHPDFENNGFFYVNYTADNPARTVIARYQVSAGDSNAADPNSELVIMEIDKPYPNHNAGALVFGPNDGYLYITTGDGGSGGDPNNNGQNRQTLLGAILRIDVDNSEGGLNYAIPNDNPFKGNTHGWREEIYAYGLRNPWRISFDPLTGWLWAADVGQNAYEEIDIIEKGKNYGWRIMEGFHCFNPPNCDTTGLTLPIWEYDHSEGHSITGGYVYRGSEIPDMVGQYVYADYVSGKIWFLEYDGSTPASNTLFKDTNLFIASFGIDEQKELYICAFDGRIYKFKFNPNSIEERPGNSQGFHLEQNYPNPFNPQTTLAFTLHQLADATLEIRDALGRKIQMWQLRNLSPGEHRVVWNGADSNGNYAGSGVYFYRLSVNQQLSETRKMILLR